MIGLVFVATTLACGQHQGRAPQPIDITAAVEPTPTTGQDVVGLANAAPDPSIEQIRRGRAGNWAAPDHAIAATVIEVIDGDTIRIEALDQTATVRLLGIDTPEKAGGPRPAECFGAEATRLLQTLLPPGSSVALSRDRASRDQYGRLLAFVHRSDQLFVNLAMVENGYATALFFSPNTSVQEDFSEAADDARRRWVGFWPACGRADAVLEANSP